MKIKSNEFTGLLRILRVDNDSAGNFKATCTLVDMIGNMLDRKGLYYLQASHKLFRNFVEEGQIWSVISGTSWSSELITEHGYARPVTTIEPIETVLIRPSGKHLIWHFTHSDWYPGIGKNKAVNLIDTLSNKNGHEPLYQALDTNNAEALFSAPQITEWDANVLIKGWAKHGSTDALKWFEEKSIDPILAKKVFDFHGENSIIAIEEDPYRLSSFNMPWKTVDALAKKTFNISCTDNRRLQAAVTEALWGAYNEYGHTKLPVSEFVPLMKRLLGGELEEWVMAHICMIEESRGILRDNYIHPFEPAVMEMMVANRIVDLVCINYVSPLSHEKISSVIAKFELVQGFNLTNQQKIAISSSVSHPFSIITGGAGVGKTTVLKALFALYDAAGYERKQLALSGRAAQRMYEATQEEASTIAGYLYHFNWDDITPEKQSKTVLVIDEASMVDIHSMYRLIDKTPEQVHIILIGDPYQLPPVGGGLVLHELVERKYLPVSELSVVKRQGKESSIPKVAENIRNGKIPHEYGNNVEFHNINKMELIDKVIEEYTKQSGKTQILCATNKLVFEINTKAQGLLNPNGVEVFYSFENLMYGTGIRLNDPVICKANIYRDEYDLRNGSMGRVIEVYRNPREIEIRKSKKSKKTVNIATYGRICWDDGSKDGYITELPLELVESIQLAYGITVHKSQGSQFPRVIFAAVKSVNLDRTLVYTAITRASQHVIVMGDLLAINRSITELPSASNRHVGLGEFIDQTLSEKSY
ncbi:MULTISPECIES: AAA family ATPase [unclassified Pseudoalteromonas]|uniref:AAA family ATPase n=1 Tax=unclassified Pseudoalteromonas TaxID=194690 RepID=UPI0005A9E2AA|nr:MULTISPECIES: AAA family ATPase [unclassified Pseudoalteromonas]